MDNFPSGEPKQSKLVWAALIKYNGNVDSIKVNTVKSLSEI